MDRTDVLDYGREAVDRTADVVLADDVVADPLSKGRSRKRKPKTAKKPVGRQVVIYAGGFGGYATEEAELKEMERNTWNPHSDDFLATASATVKGRPYGAEADGEFIGAITATSGTISRVVFIGHGSPSKLGLAGQREGSTTRFTGFIDSDGLDNWAETIRATIVPKLNENATIVIVACDVGQGVPGGAFLQKIADIFQRCVRAPSSAVYWRHPSNDEKTKITTRGLTSTDNANFAKGVEHLTFARTVCPAPPTK